MSTPPKLLIFDEYESLSRLAAEYIVFHARSAVAKRGVFTLVLSGGGTPQRLFELLAYPEHAGQISWPQTHVFWGDERCVPPDQDGSSYKQAYDAFLNKVPLPAENVHRVRGELTPEDAAEDYAIQLRNFVEKSGSAENQYGLWPLFDLVLLGMGNDGHTASLFPGPIPEREKTAPTLPVTAHYGDRPANRVSLTPLVFNAARNVFFLATGAAKAETLKAVLDGPPDLERFPAQRVQLDCGMVTWFVDQEAARLLKSERPAKG